MSPAKPRHDPLAAVLLAGGLAVVGFRLWTSLCFFPLPEWNSVRLAPSFMLRFGTTPYPGLDGGALTTWIYGPVPLLLNLPATLAHDSIAALLIAEVITLLCAVGPAALAVLAGPSPDAAATRTDRTWALLLCLSLWPNPGLHYIQADNAAVAFGLLSNWLLARRRAGAHARWGTAALCAALAVWSKQTALGLVLAQSLWLACSAGRAAAVRHAVACAACGLALGGIFVVWFGFDGLWLNLVRIPGRIPFAPDFLERTLAFKLHLAGYVLLPAALLVFAGHAIWRRDSEWLLPVLCWLCLLPAGLVATYRIGGATNSLNAFLYLLPPATLALIGWLRRRSPGTAHAWTAAAVTAVVFQQLVAAPLVPLHPLTAHLEQAEALAQRYPGRIYFPWHPLVTFFSDRRFYHAEDGLYTRSTVNLEPAPELARRDLPPAWTLSAFPGWRDEGRFKVLQPPDAKRSFFGKWTLYSWPAAEGSRHNAK